MDSLVVALVADFRNHLCCSSLYLSYFINVSSQMWIPELHWMFEIWGTWDLYNGRICSLFLYLILRAINPWTLLSVLQLFSLCCATWDLWWWWFQIQLLICCRKLLIGHVIVVVHVFESDVLHGTFINIEIHLHLFAHSTSLLIYFCSSIMLSWFLALWESLVSSENLDNLLTIFVSRSFL